MIKNKIKSYAMLKSIQLGNKNIIFTKLSYGKKAQLANLLGKTDFS